MPASTGRPRKSCCETREPNSRTCCRSGLRKRPRYARSAKRTAAASTRPALKADSGDFESSKATGGQRVARLLLPCTVCPRHAEGEFVVLDDGQSEYGNGFFSVL